MISLAMLQAPSSRTAKTFSASRKKFSIIPAHVSPRPVASTGVSMLRATLADNHIPVILAAVETYIASDAVLGCSFVSATAEAAAAWSSSHETASMSGRPLGLFG